MEGSFCVEESSVLVDGSSSTTGCSFGFDLRLLFEPVLLDTVFYFVLN